MAHKLPLVSVIITTFKRPDLLRRSMLSVLEQDYDNIEFIVIDDNDPNSLYRRDTELIIREFDKKIKYIKHNKNMGGWYARNTGIQYSNGEYIAFLDDDDEYMSDYISLQISKIENTQDKQIGFVYCQMSVYENNKEKFRTKQFVAGNKEALRIHLMGSITGTSAMLFPKKVLQDVKGFKDLNCGQDFVLILEILLKGYSIEYNKEPLVKYHIHTAQISYSYEKIIGEESLFKKRLQYSDILSNKEKKQMTYSHLISQAFISMKFSRIMSLKYFGKALILIPIKNQNILYFIKFCLPSKIFNILKYGSFFF